MAYGPARRKRRVEAPVDEVNLRGGNQQSGVAFALAEHEQPRLAPEDPHSRNEPNQAVYRTFRRSPGEVHQQPGHLVGAERIQKEGGDRAQAGEDADSGALAGRGGPYQPAMTTSLIQASGEEGPREELSERPRQPKIKRSDQIRQQILAIEQQAQALNSQRAQLLSLRNGKTNKSTHSLAASAIESQSQRFENQNFDAQLLRPETDQRQSLRVATRTSAN